MKKKNLTYTKFLKILEKNSKEHPLNIDKYNKKSVQKCRTKLNKTSVYFYIQFHCECKECNKVITKNVNIPKKYNDIDYFKYCPQCIYRHNSLEKYGVENPASLDWVQDKSKQTCLKRYGVEYSFQSDNNKEKSKQTCLEKYGVENYAQSEEWKQYLLDTYGVEYLGQSEEIKAKMRETCLERYGVEHYTQTEEWYDRAKQTCLEKYGTESWCHSDEYNKYMLDIYGTLSVVHKYLIDKIPLDSSWEVAFYIYHRDKNHTILHEPKSFEYYIDGHKHLYFPDFKVGNKYYEIKGEQFIVRYKNGNVKGMKCPFDDSLNYIYNEKYKCLRKHKVSLITCNEIKKYIDYIEDNYGLEYLDKFLISQ